jgi:thioredoxin 1
MSESNEDIEEIRARKREQLRSRAETPETPEHPIPVKGAAHLAELREDHQLLLVDFYADWCGPCKMLEPTVETVAADTPAAVAKVDIDAHQDIAREFGVQGVPTLALFAEGEAVEQLVGVQEEETLRSLVAEYAR